MMAKKGTLGEPYIHLNVRLDPVLGKAVEAGAATYERTMNQEVRYALRKFYGLDQAPAEDMAGASA
jgi:hypothetical protein